jgi:hypothetical protein
MGMQFVFLEPTNKIYVFLNPVCCLMEHKTLMKFLNFMIIDGHFYCVCHSGMVITNEISSYEFVEMKKETFLLNEFLTLENLVGLVRERLSWMDEGCEVCFEGRIDIGSSNGLE